MKRNPAAGLEPCQAHCGCFKRFIPSLIRRLSFERQGLRNELERVNAEIRSTRTFTTESSGYEREAKEQRARLSAVGLIQRDAADAHRCPLCESRLEAAPPT